MSIINETLDRLEKGNYIPAGNLETDTPDKPGLPHPVGKPRGFPVKIVAVAVLVLSTGTGLKLFQGGDTPPMLEPGEAPLESAVQPIPEHEAPYQTRFGEKNLAVADVTPAIVEVPVIELKPAVTLSNEWQRRASTSQTAEQDSETAAPAELAVTPSGPKVAEARAETGKRHIPANGTPHQAQSGEKNLAMDYVKPDIVNNAAAAATPIPERSKEMQAAPAIFQGDAVQPSDINEAVNRARLSVSKGRYQQALATLETLPPEAEGRADFWLLKGSTYLGLGQLEPAENAFASAQPLAPDNIQIAIQLAILKQEKSDHTSALQILEDTATRHPNVPEVFLNQGYSQQELGALRDAKRSFRIFLRLTEGRSLYAQQRKSVKQWLAQFHTSRN